MTADYKSIIPNKVLFNLKEVEQMGIFKVDMAKKLIRKKELEVTKIGTKLHIARDVLIKFLEKHTVGA